MTHQITLIPLSSDHHETMLQEVYANTPGYWAMYNLLTAPPARPSAICAKPKRRPGAP